MAEYPQSVKIWAYLSGTWTDITSDVLADDKITGYWGLNSNDEFDRVAAVGQMMFTLDNTTGKYAPNLGTALSGWGKGTIIKLVITYRDRQHIRFRGVVDSLSITGGTLGLRRVYVTVKDWMDYANKYPLVSPGIQTNKRADEALTTILSGMPIQPQSTTFGTGDETFPTLFDAVTTKTRAQTEFNKLALSEMGYIYLRKDWTSGETLRFDQRTYRKGTDTPTTYSVPSADAGDLLLEDGSYLLLETGDKLIIERAENLTLAIDNNMQDVGVTYGANVINRMTTIAYPRRVDTSLTVLFSLGYPLSIGPSSTIQFRGAYFDPSGGAVVNAVSNTMVAPVSSTDYLMNTASDGSGTDTTADLTITATYGTEGVTYTLTNGNASPCYITKLQARGYGVYSYAQMESASEDTTSINAYGYYSEVLTQMYQQTTQLGKVETGKILDREREPRTKLNSVVLQGNKSADFLYGFLLYDIGDLVNIAEDVSGIDAYFYIQAVNFSISPAATGGIIDYGWTVKESQSLASSGNNYSGLSLATVAFNGGNYINYGSLKTITKLVSRSYSFWIMFTNGTTGATYPFSLGLTGFPYFSIRFDVSTPTIGLYVNEGNGNYYNTTIPKTLNTWYHVVVTKDSTTVDTPPIFYINGTPYSMATSTHQTVPTDSTLCDVRLGSTTNKLKDFRVYNTILTSAQAAAISAEGAGGTGYTGSMVFQGPVTKTSESAYWTNHTMTSNDKLIENVYGDIGKIYSTTNPPVVNP